MELFGSDNYLKTPPSPKRGRFASMAIDFSKSSGFRHKEIPTPLFLKVEQLDEQPEISFMTRIDSQIRRSSRGTEFQGPQDSNKVPIDDSLEQINDSEELKQQLDKIRLSNMKKESRLEEMNMQLKS